MPYLRGKGQAARGLARLIKPSSLSQHKAVCQARGNPFHFVQVEGFTHLHQKAGSLTSPGGKAQSAQTVRPEHQFGLLYQKRAIITGASKGIGRAIALRFAKEGASCILIGRDANALNHTKEVMEDVRGVEEGSMGHDVVPGDVGSRGFWEGMNKIKGIDILVNAAGVTHQSPFVVTSHARIDEVVQTNLMGTMMACRVVGKGMMQNRKGSIINVSSLLGLKGGRGSAAYAASKAGVIGLSRALAAELGEKNVRVNVIVPGYIETDMTAAMTPEARSAALNAIPLKSFGNPHDIADAAVFLAVNNYTNNCVLNIDGGLSAT
ncbi:hypothetical protein BGZ60DRAFT_170351 [Tricladium varicosporioides]|nr:hypothetical protein BGZ60DRAFT_170351 [Hymenoscyphus varicosporioides]